MRFEMGQLAGCEGFGSCRFYTSVEGKMISGFFLVCAYTPDKWEPENILLVCGPILPKGEKELAICLDEMVMRRVTGFLVAPPCADEEQIFKLQGACRRRNLVFGTMPSDSWPAMIQEFGRLTASRTDGKIRPYDRVLEDLQQRSYTGGTEALLDGLSYWTGYQAALIAGQDTFVCSSMPLLDETVFYPAYWHKEPRKLPFSHIGLYTSSRSDKRILQAGLYKDRMLFGVLCLIAEEEKNGDGTGDCFEMSDVMLLDHAAILCAGIDDYRRRSCRIEDAIECFSKGRTPDDAELELFPSSGYALVLRDQETETEMPFFKEKMTGRQDYVSYLLRHSFPGKLCHGFSQDGSLRLFVSADDVEQFGKKLLAILDRAGGHYRAGVSRHYRISQAATAFLEAENAVHIAQLLEYEERLCHYYDLGIYRLLNYPENSWPVNQMLGEMDELLNQMDQEKRDMLAMTVRVFVNCRFSYQKTADKLYTHVNTVRYRIKLIEDLWDVNLSSDEGRLLFSVLAKLLPLWMKSGHYKGTLPTDEEKHKNQKQV